MVGGLTKIEIVLVGIVAYAHGGEVVVRVGKIPVLSALVQTHQLSGEALGLPTKFRPPVLTKHDGATVMTGLALADARSTCC